MSVPSTTPPAVCKPQPRYAGVVNTAHKGSIVGMYGMVAAGCVSAAAANILSSGRFRQATANAFKLIAVASNRTTIGAGLAAAAFAAVERVAIRAGRFSPTKAH